MGVRIVDIAERAEVSPSAVSLALHSRPGVSLEVRERILRVAEELGYRRAEVEGRRRQEAPLRFLKIAKHGHIVNPRHNVFIADYIEGLEQEAKGRGFVLEVGFFDRVPMQEIVASVREAKIGGVVVLGTELDYPDMEAFRDLPLPVVFIDTFNPFLPFDFADMNNTDEVYKIVEHFFKRGHREIGLVKGSIETRNFKMRERGFAEALEHFGLEYDKDRVFSVDPVYEQGRLDMLRELPLRKALPTALFCVNDIVAYGVIRALKESGLSVPEDVSIIGFDDLPSSSYTEPPLTTIRVSKHQIGRRAMQLLISRLTDHPEASPEKVLVGGELVVRESVRDLKE